MSNPSFDPKKAKQYFDSLPTDCRANEVGDTSAQKFLSCIQKPYMLDMLAAHLTDMQLSISKEFLAECQEFDRLPKDIAFSGNIDTNPKYYIHEHIYPDWWRAKKEYRALWLATYEEISEKII